MEPIRKEDIKQEVFDLYDDYAHSRINRRAFLDKLSLYAVGSVTVPSLLSFIMPNYQDKIQVAEDDPRLKTQTTNYESPKGGGTISGQLSMPKEKSGKMPGILVVHENRGLNPHIADVGRRAALAGFVSLSPDALSPLGGYPGTDDKGREMQRERDRNEMLEDFIAGFRLFEGASRLHRKGRGSWFLLWWLDIEHDGGRGARSESLCPLLRRTTRRRSGAPDSGSLDASFRGTGQTRQRRLARLRGGAEENNKEYQAFMYPGVNHGFHNDTTPRYDKDAAELAWGRTIEFFEQKLK